ncbi:MAG: hypothetical protein ACKVU0_06460 [Saprospiraceae bacterium]
MKNKIFLLLLPLLAVLWLFACRKDSPLPNTFQPIDYTVLPPITQTGANTFGCLVDGEVWVPRIDVRSFDPTRHEPIATVHESTGTGTGGITCTLLDFDLKQDDWLQITFGPTFFQSVQNCDPIFGVGATFSTTSGEWYQSTYHHSNENCVTITRIDTANNIISGIFQFVLYNDAINLNDKITITEGRFDMPYYPQ